MVKSTAYPVKVRNPSTPAQVPQVPATLLHQPQLVFNNIQSVPNTVVMTRPSSIPSIVTNVPAKQQIVRTPGVSLSQPTPAIQTVDEIAFPASQLLSQFTAPTVKKLQSPPFVQAVPGGQVAPAVQATLPVVQLPGPGGTTKKTIQPIQPSKPIEMIVTPGNQATKITPTITTLVKKNAPSVSSPEDQKMLNKTIPSLCVVVRPASSVPDAVNVKKRETLGEVTTCVLRFKSP